MPYEIVKRGNKWCVQKEGGGKSFGCHPSKAKAEAQMRAIYASENKSLTVFKGDDGARYMLLVSTNSYEDREAQTMHGDALKAYVAEHWTDEAFKADNALLFWHDGPAIGSVVWADMHGPWLVEVAKERASGLSAVKSYVDAIWTYLEKTDEPYGASIGFAYRNADLEPDGKRGTFRSIRKFETSVLPLEAAANPYTFSGVLSMSNAREKKLEEITGKPGILANLKRLLTGAEDTLAESGVQHKQLGPVATRDDLIDLVVLVTKNTMARAVEIGQKAAEDNADAPEIDLHQIAGAALDEMLDVPAVALETAEQILAVDETEGEGEDAQGEAETDAPAEAETDKALTALAALTTSVITDQGAILNDIKALTDAVKGIAELPARMATMETAIKAMQAQFEQRPRASQASETEAPEGIQKAMETLAAAERQAKSGIWPA